MPTYSPVAQILQFEKISKTYLLIAVVAIKSGMVHHMKRVASAWPGESIMTCPSRESSVNYEGQADKRVKTEKGGN